MNRLGFHTLILQSVARANMYNCKLYCIVQYFCEHTYMWMNSWLVLKLEWFGCQPQSICHQLERLLNYCASVHVFVVHASTVHDIDASAP